MATLHPRPRLPPTMRLTARPALPSLACACILLIAPAWAGARRAPNPPSTHLQPALRVGPAGLRGSDSTIRWLDQGHGDADEATGRRLPRDRVRAPRTTAGRPHARQKTAASARQKTAASARDADLELARLRRLLRQERTSEASAQRRQARARSQRLYALAQTDAPILADTSACKRSGPHGEAIYENCALSVGGKPVR